MKLIVHYDDPSDIIFAMRSVKAMPADSKLCGFLYGEPFEVETSVKRNSPESMTVTIERLTPSVLGKDCHNDV